MKYYWILKTDEKEKAIIQTIPSGCMHLVFHRGDNLHFSPNSAQPKCFIRGQLSTPGNLISEGGIDMIAVVFQPLGMTPFIAHPMTEFYNQYIDTDCIGDFKLNNLKSLILNEENVNVCVQHIELFLSGRLTDMDYNYLRIAKSIQLITNQPEIKMDLLADDVCLGYRQFIRVFTKYIGMNPKEYYKVIRFQRALYTLQKTPDMEITQLAYVCGYYDHSHLIKDFKAFTGVVPLQYLASRVPYSTFFSKDCQLNLINHR